VDDEEALMTALCKTLEVEGYSVAGFTSARQALAHLREQPFDLLLTDLMMPEMDGIALLRAAQEIDGDLAGVVMTGHGTVDTAVQALRGGAADYVLKPFRLHNLLSVLDRALETRRLRTENIQLREAVSCDYAWVVPGRGCAAHGSRCVTTERRGRGSDPGADAGICGNSGTG
jgi:two-component system sensor histidine kinase/response regulator